jgi:hypothetical protein
MLAREDTMNLKHLLLAVPTTLLVLGSGVANAGQTINEAATMACVNDKWTRRSLRRATS